MHVVAYLGDVSGDGIHTSLDASLTSRIATNFDTGYAAYRLADPVIVGDLNNNGGVPDSTDVTLTNRHVAGITTPQVPTPPTGLSLAPAGPDPTLSLPTNLVAGPGEVIVVPVYIDTARPEGSTGMLEAVLALRFDPQVFTVSAADIQLGSLPNSGVGWKLTSAINADTGEIGIDLFSTVPFASRTGGSLVTVALHVREIAPAGTSAINLVSEVNPTGRRLYRTAVAEALGTFVLHPLPTEGYDAGVDGSVIIPSFVPNVSNSVSAQPALVTSQAAMAELVEERTFDILLASSLAASDESELAATAVEKIFADMEEGEGLRPVEMFGQEKVWTGSESKDSTEKTDGDLVLFWQTADGLQPDWLSDDHGSYLEKTKRRPRRILPAGSQEDALSETESGDTSGLEEFFAQTASNH